MNTTLNTVITTRANYAKSTSNESYAIFNHCDVMMAWNFVSEEDARHYADNAHYGLHKECTVRLTNYVSFAKSNF
jgi:hypothetical protein